MVKPLRIAHVLFRLDYGGLENGVVNIIGRLPCEEFDHTVISLTDSTDFRRRLRHNVPLIEVHKPPGNSLAYLHRLWQILRKGRFDILHTRNLPCLESQLAGLLAGVPARIHGEHGWDVFDLHGSVRRYRLLRRAFRPLVNRYVVVSRHLERYLTECVGVNPERITRIANGVDTRHFQPSGHGENGGQFVVGSVGRMEAVKDYMTLARAFAVLARKANKPSRLTIVGDGAERRAVAGYLADAGLASVCELNGASDDVAQLMRKLSVFVLPSKAEGMSNTILEAMATGLPVIATAVGGNAELVIDGETGYLVPAGDFAAMAERLAYYRDNPEVRTRHARAARERVMSEFSIDSMVAGYRRLYEDCAVAARLPQAAP